MSLIGRFGEKTENIDGWDVTHDVTSIIRNRSIKRKLSSAYVHKKHPDVLVCYMCGDGWSSYIEKTDGFGYNFNDITSGASYEELQDAVMKKIGVRVLPGERLLGLVSERVHQWHETDVDKKPYEIPKINYRGQ